MKKYYKRIADSMLKDLLTVSGGILIEGPKYCGKTKTAEQISKSQVYLQDADKLKEYRLILDTKPSLLLQGEKPRLIDEWQDAPILWDAIRFEIDKRNEKGLFILTGSAVEEEGVVSHTGTGRIARFKMRPMSLYESLNSTGEVSLKDLFDNKQEISGVSKIKLEDIISLIARGGWPATLEDSEDSALKSVVNYVEGIIHQDLSRVDGVKRNPSKIRNLLRSYSRNISTTATFRTIRDDIMNGNEEELSEKSIADYINALEKIHVIEDIPAWNPILRSKTAIRTSSKRQFVDPSIAVATMRLTPKSLYNDFNYLGFLFESLCERDLRIYAESIDGTIYHYRDKMDYEIDAIVVLNDGRYGMIEIKLGNGQIDEAANNLIKVANRIDTEKQTKPSFLMVLTGTEYAYKRDDGVLVVPVGCLKN